MTRTTTTTAPNDSDKTKTKNTQKNMNQITQIKVNRYMYSFSVSKNCFRFGMFVCVCSLLIWICWPFSLKWIACAEKKLPSNSYLMQCKCTQRESAWGREWERNNFVTFLMPRERWTNAHWFITIRLTHTRSHIDGIPKRNCAQYFSLSRHLLPLNWSENMRSSYIDNHTILVSIWTRSSFSRALVSRRLRTVTSL